MPRPQIQSLYETHLDVSSLESSIEFYSDVIGLNHCHTEPERRVAFFWIEERKSMLGIWERPADEIEKRHFAFKVSPTEVLESVEWLERQGLQPYNFFRDGSTEPMVFAWLPAVAIYFRDPDGHGLEFIGLLDEAPAPDRGVVPYSEWIN